MSYSTPPASCKVYTPEPLASAMVRTLIKPQTKQSWLEPSSGKGVFLASLNKLGVPRSKITGIDLDSVNSEFDRFASTKRRVDFLKWSSSRKPQFDCIIGNPPYVSISKLESPGRQQAAATLDLDGKPIGERSNLWYPFFTQAIRLLKQGGSIALVLPSACEYADYCAIGRTKLPSMFDRVDLIRSRRPLFESVQEGSVLLIARNKGGTKNLFRRHLVDDLDSAIARLENLGKLPARCIPKQRDNALQDNHIRCSEVMDIRIGGVTGDASYFVLSAKQADKHKLPNSALQPVLSKSHHIYSSVQNQRSWTKLKDAGERVFLFRPNEIALRSKHVRSYLDLPLEQGGCNRNRHKISSRDPWFTTPLPKEGDLFFSGMSQNGLWICVNEMQNLNVTNTLYVGSFRRKLSRAERFSWALTFLTSPVRKQIARKSRTYAGGLKKIEPGQIGQIQLPVPGRIKNAVSVYKEASKLYLRGQHRDAMLLADEAVLAQTLV